MYKFTAVLLIASVGFSAAQSLAGLPACAIDCVRQGLPSNCNLDPKCICSSSSFIDAISCCVAGACSVNDQNATLTYARTICEPAGVSDLPSAATCAPGASSSSSGSSTDSSSATSSASDAASSASESASSATSSASEAGSSASSSAAAAATDSDSGASAKGLGALGAGLLGVAALL